MPDFGAPLKITFDHDGPLPLADFTEGLGRLAVRYNRFSRGLGEVDDARLYIARVREGSIEIDLVGAAVTAQAVLEGAGGLNNLIEFGKNVAGLLDRFGKGDVSSADVSISDCDDVRAMVKPALHTEGGGLTIAVNGDNNVVQPLIVIDRQNAREIDNRAAIVRAALTQPVEAVREEVLFVWDQIRDAPAVEEGKRSPDRAVIASIDRKAHPVTFADPAVKDAMYRTAENPFERGFIVDTKVLLGPNGVAGYRVTKVHEDIPLDSPDAA